MSRHGGSKTCNLFICFATGICLFPGKWIEVVVKTVRYIDSDITKQIEALNEAFEVDGNEIIRLESGDLIQGVFEHVTTTVFASVRLRFVGIAGIVLTDGICGVDFCAGTGFFGSR